jgi:hypothetical protein
MPRWMSFSMTQQQMRDGTKDVTRRLGWRFAKVGMQALAVSKSQGRKAGEQPEVFGLVEFIEVSRPLLSPIAQDEVDREGFPDLTPREFVAMFCEHMRCTPLTPVTRIAFKWVWKRCYCDEPDGPCEDCRDPHGHTCIVCGYEWCQECWGGELHAEYCNPEERERRLA